MRREIREMKRPRVADLRTIPQFVEECPAFTERQVEGWIARREINGLEEAGALTKVEGRWRIYLPGFDAWFFESQETVPLGRKEQMAGFPRRAASSGRGGSE